MTHRAPRLALFDAGNSIRRIDVPSSGSARAEQRRWVPVRHLVEDLLAEARTTRAPGSIRAEVDCSERLLVLADPDRFRRAVAMLLAVVLEGAGNAAGPADLCITGCDGPAGFELEIADSGPGMSDLVRSLLAGPVVCARPIAPEHNVAEHNLAGHAAAEEGGGGIAARLAIIRAIARDHGGDLTACDCPQGGSAFTLRIARPAQQAAA
jgi:K+-sensing histidine kinase KdpD